MKAIRWAALAACLAVPVLAAPVQAAPLGPWSNFIVFGDSLSDPGNLAAVSGNTIPNPAIYPSGQFTNGNTWATQLGATVASGSNFAYGGATAASIAPTYTFAGEINLYNQAKPALGSAPLGVVWLGGNDFLNLLSSGTPTVSAGLTAAQNAIGAIDSGVSALSATGLSHIVVFGLPDLGLLPGVVNTSLQGTLSGLSGYYNGTLQASLTKLTLAPGTTVDYFDVSKVFSDLLGQASALGITDFTTPCVVNGTVCQNPDTHLFYDDVHPTEVVHTYLANAFRSAYAPVAAVPLPASSLLLLAALALVAGLGLARRSPGSARVS